MAYHQIVPTKHVDTGLLVATTVLVIFGLVSVYSASAHQALIETGNCLTILIRQLIAAVIGVVAMAFTIRVPFYRWRTWAFPLAFLVIGLLLVTQFVGVTANGSERWIPLPFGFQLQPSDFAKLATIGLMATAISGQRKFSLVRSVPMLGLIGIMMALVYVQPNLSVTLMMAAITLAMTFAAGANLLWYAAASPLLWLVAHKIQNTPYQWRRITGWLNPWGDPQDTGYNLIQSYYAIGSGGWFGNGFGNSVQKLYYLPFQHTDFIFAVICEEQGFVGALGVIAMFAFWSVRGYRVSLKAAHPFGQMLAFGITTTILLQAMINISVTVGLMPVTGVTLPFISYGGTSLVTTLAMVGILMNISRYTAVPSQQVASDDQPSRRDRSADLDLDLSVDDDHTTRRAHHAQRVARRRALRH
jgi:cell division protein FtsW